MLALLRQQGVSLVVATPHFYANSDYPQDFLRRREEALAKLSKTETPRILLGAEVAYFDGMSHCEELALLQLGQSGLVLVEMPFGPWSDRMVEEICRLETTLGVRPVLAHIDRYLQKNQLKKYWEVLLDNDVYFQCNADIFFHRWKRRWVLQLMKDGNIHFLGSDCHNLQTRPPKLKQAAEVITRELGENVLQELDKTTKTILKVE